MKNLFYIGTILILLSLFSCNSQTDAQKEAQDIANAIGEQTAAPEKPATDGSYMKATIDGKKWTANSTMTDNEPSSSYKLVHGKSDDFYISYYIYKPVTGNKRPFTEQNVAQFGTSDGSFDGNKGELIVTRADNEWVEGTFHFTASSGSGSSKVYEITDGSFRVKATFQN